MFQPRSTALLGLLGLVVSWIVIGSLTGSRSSEALLESPICLQPPIQARIVRPSKPVPISVKGSGFELPLGLSFSRSGKYNAGKNLTYAIGIRPVQVEHVEPTVVATGQILASHDSCQPTITVKNATLGGSFEVTVEVAKQTNGTLATQIGKDIVYLTVVQGSDVKEKEVMAVEVTDAATFWDNWLLDLYRNNKTIPTLPHPSDSPSNCTCADDTNPFELEPTRAEDLPTPVLLRPTPIGGELPPRGKFTRDVSIHVRWQDVTAPAGASIQPLSGATVWIYIHSMEDSTRTLYAHSSLTLNAAGRARKTISVPRSQYIALVTVAFDNRVLRFVSTTTSHAGRTGGIEYPLPYHEEGDDGAGTLTVDEVIPDSYGPGLVRMWREFNGIWAAADAAVGMWDVPKISVLYPSDWSRYLRGQGKIQMWGSVGLESADHFAHELGHHFMHTVAGGIPGPGGEHGICDGTVADRGLAFSEGFASAFAATVLGRQVVGGVDYGAYSCGGERDMETSEGRVAAGLMDLVDGGTGAECNGGNADLGRNGVCDNTVAGQLFTPRLVFRDSITRVVDGDVTAWWGRIRSAYSTRTGYVAGRHAMEYNYFTETCLLRVANICIRGFPLGDAFLRLRRGLFGG